MKKTLTLLGTTISLIGTSTISLVACNTPQKYTKDKLAKLKKENQINTKDGILEWIAPQEKPFNKTDNKWYYVIYRANKDAKLQIKKGKNNDKEKKEIIFTDEVGIPYRFEILSLDNYDSIYMKNYFKSVYRWNLDTKEPDLIIDNKGNIKVKGE